MMIFKKTNQAKIILIIPILFLITMNRRKFRILSFYLFLYVLILLSMITRTCLDPSLSDSTGKATKYFLIILSSASLCYYGFLARKRILFLSILIVLLFLSVSLGFIFNFKEGFYPRNIFSFLAILVGFVSFLSFINKESFHQRRRWATIFSSLILLISFFSIGRSGIISSTLVFFLVLLRRSILKALLSTIITAALIVFLINLAPLSSLRDSLSTKILESVAYQDPREIIIEEYLSLLTPQRTLTGVDLSKINILTEKLGGNTHNVFLQLHATLGFFAIIIFSIIPFSLFVMLKNNYFCFCFCLGLMLRSMTDSALSDDFFIFSLFMITLYCFVGQNNGTCKARNRKKVALE